MSSIILPSKTPCLRRNSYQAEVPPPLPPRRHSLTVPPLQLKSVTLSGGMESRYNRPSSPRSRLVNPARSSTGTFSNPSYYDSSYYVRPSSPRTSGDRIPGSLHQTYYTSSGPSGSRTASLKYDSYSGRPRRNTDDRMIRPDISTIAPTSNTTVVPIRTHASHTHHYDRPQSPLSSSWNNRGETYITHGPSSRREHKRYYSVDDNSHSSKLVAEREIIEPRRHDTADSRGYSVTSGGRSYHHQQPITGQTNINDEGFSYTDAAGMYRDTEPAWRRPRSGSMERSSRPTSMIMERAPRSSARDLGPPPSMRGFDKIKPPRSSSIDRSREIPKYDPYPEAPSRTSSARQHYSPAIHQEPRENGRETFHEGYDRRDRDLENRRYPTADRFEDRDVAARGFGIAPGITQESHPVDRQPVWNAGDMSRSRPDDYNAPYHPSDRVDNRVPEARMPEARMPEPRIPREREPASNYTHNHASHAHNYKQYEERPRERENNRRESNNVTPIVAGAVTGAAATIGAAEYLKSRDRERDRGERPREQGPDRDRERRKEWDERERRDRAPEQRTEDRRERERVPENRLPPAAAAYASTQEPDRKSYDRRYEEDDRDRRSSRKPPSPEGSGDERPRHYVDRDNERRAEAVAKEAPLDPDEEYRRRIEQEAQRNGRRDRDTNDTDRERERQRRKEERNNARDVGDDRSRGSPTNISERAEPARSRYDERSNSVFDNAIVQEPESLDQPSKSVQIVAPPKEPAAPLKGILRKPTEKFPEDPDPIREGVAPHKSQNKGKDIPQGARWTRIDRRLVNPEALEEAKERFEERMDCVIVLRVLTKDEIQKLADRTKAIREAREDEYERRERRDRDRRSYRDYGDEEDRDRGDRRRDYSDYDDLESRGRDRDRDRPRMIESGR